MIMKFSSPARDDIGYTIHDQTELALCARRDDGQDDDDRQWREFGMSQAESHAQVNDRHNSAPQVQHAENMLRHRGYPRHRRPPADFADAQYVDAELFLTEGKCQNLTQCTRCRGRGFWKTLGRHLEISWTMLFVRGVL